jgi:hypothetical protein
MPSKCDPSILILFLMMIPIVVPLSDSSHLRLRCARFPAHCGRQELPTLRLRDDRVHRLKGGSDAQNFGSYAPPPQDAIAMLQVHNPVGHEQSRIPWLRYVFPGIQNHNPERWASSDSKHNTRDAREIPLQEQDIEKSETRVRFRDKNALLPATHVHPPKKNLFTVITLHGCHIRR